MIRHNWCQLNPEQSRMCGLPPAPVYELTFSLGRYPLP